MARRKARKLAAKLRKEEAELDSALTSDDDFKKGKKNKKGENSSTDFTDADSSQSLSVDDPPNIVQEVMSDNLDLMLEIIMQIREDEDFAKSIYQDCPRLQHMLDQYPDLRPIFEDPHLVRINFEQVYRKAGGVLPEDRPNFFKKTLSCIVKHPLFKVFRFLLLIRKLYNYIFGGKLLMIRNFFLHLFTSSPAHLIHQGMNNADELVDNADLNPENLANKNSLNKVADNMEDPDVQDQMQNLLQGDPDQLEEAIENDPDLKALRASNPLCAELMSDPSTMKIMVDPDNLRALGDCPNLIEADFNDPNWSPPDVESVPFDDPDYGGADQFVDAPDVDADANVDGPGGDGDVGVDDNQDYDDDNNDDNGDDNGGDGGAGDDGGGFMDNYERGDQTDGNGNGNGNNTVKKLGGDQKKQQQQKKQNRNAQGGGFFSSLGAGLVDYIAAETVGMTASEFTMGGDDFGVEDVVDDQAAEAAEGAASNVDQASSNVQNFTDASSTVVGLADNDDFAQNLESTMDTVEEAGDGKGADGNTSVGQNAQAAAMSGATGGVLLAGGGGVDKTRGQGQDIDEDDETEEEEKEKPKKNRLRRFGGAIGGGLAALSSAAKEYAMGAVLGEDLAEVVTDRMEGDEDKNKEGEEDDDKKGDKDGKEVQENKSEPNEKEQE
jgi:hypothetical protein